MPAMPAETIARQPAPVDDHPDPRAGERRAFPRFPMGTRAKVWATWGTGGYYAQTAIVRDLSVTGVGILSNWPLAVGDAFVLHMVDRRGSQARVHCVVQRCEPGGFGGVAYVLGARFSSASEGFSMEVAAPAGDEGTRSTPSGVAESERKGARTRRALNLLRLLCHWERRRDDLSSG